ncbi:NAD(P)/FAD-dependent oxidoreductase [Arthrobacter sp. HY1533]|uniref:NAD(P)/FAD-dependent oxidoreductase n=1 Tax=Arthrobacter sp. HY1533 TaxID=2970919 RepID=UPI0022B9D50A|nr:NAD(P)/FAD-dependent oxidoreductase [Arthrobacter sp. HY1533]
MQDAIIIGGGAAGLSAALQLGRSRRTVTVVDAGKPRNAPSPAAHGFLTRDGVAPHELTRLGRADLELYDVRVIDGTVVSAEKMDGVFHVALADGTSIEAPRLLVTTGVVDELPAIPGLAERWGHDLVHCPYCHGWEIRDHAIGVIGSSSMAVHQALLFRQWSPNITLFLNSAPEPAATERRQLAARGVRLVEGAVARIHSTDGAVSGVELADGSLHRVDALTAQSRVVARASFLTTLGLAPVPGEFGELLQVDGNGLTAIPGVWAAGNVADMRATVLAAAYAGAMAGVAINMDMIAAELAADVAAFDAAEPLVATG